jgi:hypothetical protein
VDDRDRHSAANHCGCVEKSATSGRRTVVRHDHGGGAGPVPLVERRHGRWRGTLDRRTRGSKSKSRLM